MFFIHKLIIDGLRNSLYAELNDKKLQEEASLKFHDEFCMLNFDSAFEAQARSIHVNSNRVYTNKVTIWSDVKYTVKEITSKTTALSQATKSAGLKASSKRSIWLGLLLECFEKLYKDNDDPNPFIVNKSLNLVSNRKLVNIYCHQLSRLLADYLFCGKAYLVHYNEETNCLGHEIELPTYEG